MPSSLDGNWFRVTLVSGENFKAFVRSTEVIDDEQVYTFDFGGVLDEKGNRMQRVVRKSEIAEMGMRTPPPEFKFTQN